MALSVVRKVQPTAGDVHVNTPLTNLSIAYMQSADNFIADRVFPMVPVPNQSNSYYKYKRENWFKMFAERRAPGSESAGGGWTLDTDTYNAEVWAIHKDVDDQIRANTDPAVSNLDRDASEWVTQQLLIRRDYEWTTSYFTTGQWTGATGSTDITGVVGVPSTNEARQWNDVESTPIQDVDVQRLSMAQKTGLTPNTLVLGPEVFGQLKNHPDVLDRIKYTQRGMVTPDLLASMFEVERVLIPMAVRNTAAEGATLSNSFMYGKNALLCYSAPSPGLMQPSAGYTFAWTGFMGAQAMGTRIKRFRQENLESDRVEGQMSFDLKLVASDLGVYFTSIVA